ncbi:MAG: DNA primase [bacterium]|nr:DNA primase [bacterium]
MSGKIPENAIEEVLHRINALDIFGRYMQLRRQGSKYVALCPFHNEKTPSLSIDPDKGLWYCFGCKKGGSVFQFVMEMDGLSFFETVSKLADEAGVKIDCSPEAQEADSSRKRGLDLLDRAAKFYNDVLFNQVSGEKGRGYLAERGISRETADKFRLGWAPSAGGSLLQILERAGFSAQEACECGIAMRHDYGMRDLLRDRLVFPICDHQGRVIAFGGRIIGDGQPKYLNSPETAWYSKRRHLYALDVARGAIKRSEKAIITEGYFDAVSMHQAGYGMTIASLGTALTPEQASLLHRYTNNVILAYDADTAGEMAIIKGSEILEDAGMRTSTVIMPSGEDPDSLARRGEEAVKAIFEKPVGIVNFQIERALKKIDITSPEGKEDFIKEVLPSVERIKDSARQDGYIQVLAYYTGISETKLHWRLRRKGNFSQTAKRDRLLTAEEKLLCICVSFPQWRASVKEKISAEMIETKWLKPVFAAIFASVESDEPAVFSELEPYLDSKEQSAKLAEILAREEFEPTPEDVSKLISAVEDKYLRGRLDVLRKEVLPAIEAGKISPDSELYREYNSLRKHFSARGQR